MEKNKISCIVCGKKDCKDPYLYCRKCMYNNNKIIISIDPGDRYVGVVIFDISSKDIRVYQFDTQSKLCPPILQGLAGTISEYYETYEVIVVVENFINYTHKNNIKGFKENKTSEMIGALRSICSSYGVELVLQTASQAKSWTDDRLLRLRLMNKDGKCFKVNEWTLPRHARDAYRHLIYYTNKNLFKNCINVTKLFEKKEGK